MKDLDIKECPKLQIFMESMSKQVNAMLSMIKFIQEYIEHTNFDFSKFFDLKKIKTIKKKLMEISDQLNLHIEHLTNNEKFSSSNKILDMLDKNEKFIKTEIILENKSSTNKIKKNSEKNEIFLQNNNILNSRENFLLDNYSINSIENQVNFNIKDLSFGNSFSKNNSVSVSKKIESDLNNIQNISNLNNSIFFEKKNEFGKIPKLITASLKKSRKKGGGRKTNPELEKKMKEWVFSFINENKKIPRRINILEEAEKFKSDHFKASKGWCDKFVKRNKLKFEVCLEKICLINF